MINLIDIKNKKVNVSGIQEIMGGAVVVTAKYDKRQKGFHVTYTAKEVSGDRDRPLVTMQFICVKGYDSSEFFKSVEYIKRYFESRWWLID